MAKALVLQRCLKLTRLPLSEGHTWFPISYYPKAGVDPQPRSDPSIQWTAREALLQAWSTKFSHGQRLLHTSSRILMAFLIDWIFIKGIAKIFLFIIQRLLCNKPSQLIHSQRSHSLPFLHHVTSISYGIAGKFLAASWLHAKFNPRQGTENRK